MNIREREQLEYIHSVLQECSNKNIDNVMISQALEYVEIIREQHFKEDESYSEVCDKLDSGEYYSYDK
jgi:hypothetical protein